MALAGLDEDAVWLAMMDIVASDPDSAITFPPPPDIT
jgi:hypothetical protein